VAEKRRRTAVASRRSLTKAEVQDAGANSGGTNGAKRLGVRQPSGALGTGDAQFRRDIAMKVF